MSRYRRRQLPDTPSFSDTAPRSPAVRTSFHDVPATSVSPTYSADSDVHAQQRRMHTSSWDGRSFLNEDAVTRSTSRPSPRPHHEETPSSGVFDRVDANVDGSLSKDEMRVAARNVAHSAVPLENDPGREALRAMKGWQAERRVDQAFIRIDSNGDGVVSRHEFLQHARPEDIQSLAGAVVQRTSSPAVARRTSSPAFVAPKREPTVDSFELHAPSLCSIGEIVARVRSVTALGENIGYVLRDTHQELINDTVLLALTDNSLLQHTLDELKDSLDGSNELDESSHDMIRDKIEKLQISPWLLEPLLLDLLEHHKSLANFQDMLRNVRTLGRGNLAYEQSQVASSQKDEEVGQSASICAPRAEAERWALAFFSRGVMSSSLCKRTQRTVEGQRRRVALLQRRHKRLRKILAEARALLPENDNVADDTDFDPAVKPNVGASPNASSRFSTLVHNPSGGVMMALPVEAELLAFENMFDTSALRAVWTAPEEVLGDLVGNREISAASSSLEEREENLPREEKFVTLGDPTIVLLTELMQLEESEALTLVQLSGGTGKEADVQDARRREILQEEVQQELFRVLRESQRVAFDLVRAVEVAVKLECKALMTQQSKVEEFVSALTDEMSGLQTFVNLDKHLQMLRDEFVHSITINSRAALAMPPPSSTTPSRFRMPIFGLPQLAPCPPSTSTNETAVAQVRLAQSNDFVRLVWLCWATVAPTFGVYE